MDEKCKIILKKSKKPLKAQIFVWKTYIEGFNLRHRFYTCAFFKPSKAQVQKKNQIYKLFPSIMLIQILIQNGGSPIFVWDSQETFSPVFYRKIVILKNLDESIKKWLKK
jgi:hypothetical protein